MQNELIIKQNREFSREQAINAKILAKYSLNLVDLEQRAFGTKIFSKKIAKIWLETTDSFHRNGMMGDDDQEDDDDDDQVEEEEGFEEEDEEEGIPKKNLNQNFRRTGSEPTKCKATPRQ